MRPILFSLSLIVLGSWLISPACLAQNPSYDVTILADGKPLDLSQGISVRTKSLRITGQLTQKSQQRYPQFKPIVLINKATLNLVRETRRVRFTNWLEKESTANVFKEAKAGDRFIIQFEDVALQTKQGTTQRIDDPKIIQITINQ